MARNEEKQNGRLNRLILQQQKEQQQSKHPPRPHLGSLHTAVAVRKWLPTITRDMHYYLSQSEVCSYPPTKIAEFAEKLQFLQRQYRAFRCKLRQLDPQCNTADWQARPYKRPCLHPPDHSEIHELSGSDRAAVANSVSSKDRVADSADSDDSVDSDTAADADTCDGGAERVTSESSASVRGSGGRRPEPAEESERTSQRLLLPVLDDDDDDDDVRRRAVTRSDASSPDVVARWLPNADAQDKPLEFSTNTRQSGVSRAGLCTTDLGQLEEACTTDLLQLEEACTTDLVQVDDVSGSQRTDTGAGSSSCRPHCASRIQRNPLGILYDSSSSDEQ